MYSRVKKIRVAFEVPYQLSTATRHTESWDLISVFERPVPVLNRVGKSRKRDL